MRPGHLALILHAHLPYVRHPEHEEFYEEDWLFEAITETYIPLLLMMRRLLHDGVPFKLTMSITPPLCAMLNDELLRARYVRHLERLIELAQREIERRRDQPELQELAGFYHELFRSTRERFEEWKRDLIGVFRELQETGALEITGCAATHGLLPLISQSPEAVRAQILIGRDVYRENFGRDPVGFWLPECAYAPGLETILQEANIRWFVLDAHGLAFGKPRPRHAIYAPCFTAAGPAAFARDPESSREVWSAECGYPGDPAYREFYRDLGFDLPENGETRIAAPRFTGIKYHRITGRDAVKEIYQRDWADRVAAVHADHFLESRREQLRGLRGIMSDPIVVMPFDAELFGHWWFEGPRFLENFIRAAASHGDELRLTTPSEFLARDQTHEIIAPAASSWGENGYWSVWLHETNSWIYPHLHAAARRMSECARAYADEPNALTSRVLSQLARELLLAQSSDWAFLIKTGTAKHYAAKRVNDHLLRFDALHQQLKAGVIDEASLAEIESRDNLFPKIEWRYFF